MDQKVAAILTFRLDEAEAKTWAHVSATQPSQTANGAFRIILENLDAAVRRKLDPAALELYESGKLDRAEWRRACGRYPQRKATIAEQVHE